MVKLCFYNTSNQDKLDLEKLIENQYLTIEEEKQEIHGMFPIDSLFKVIIELSISLIPILVAWILKNKNKKEFEIQYENKKYPGEYTKYTIKYSDYKSKSEKELAEYLKSLIFKNDMIQKK